MRFTNREQAGEKLAEAVESLVCGDKRVHHVAPLPRDEYVVFAIPRGGVVLGVEVANRLHCPLDLVITRKVGHPGNPEYALCVVAEDGHEICNEGELSSVDKAWLQEEKKKERAEAKRRRLVYLGDRPRLSVAGKTAIVVDDGIATGMTFIAALREVRELQPARLVAAVPVMPAEFLVKLKKECDEVVCLNIDPAYLGAVGAYYEDFPQVSDEEVVNKLENSKTQNIEEYLKMVKGRSEIERAGL